jgi:hypothetical protein
MIHHADEPRRLAPGMPQADGAAVPTAEASEPSDHLGQGDGDDVKRAERDANSRQGAPAPSDRLPPAGPHADPKLVNPDATPGSGTLTPPGRHGDTDSTSG